MMSENEYYKFVLRRYVPSKYESNELTDPRFQPGTYYSHICKTRAYLVYREIAGNLDHYRAILDFGLFPGTILRQLKILLKDRIRCYGVGLNVDGAFRSFMSEYLEDCFDVELDPFYARREHPDPIPIASGTIDMVVATEILEHLVSPLEMIAEGARILRKGGAFLITTPNVSHIGAVLKLLLGRSNYEPLDRSPMYMKTSKWRGHIRYYDKRELAVLFQRAGLFMIRHRYYTEKGWEHAKWPPVKRLVHRFVDLFFPIYREGHFAVFQKI